MKGANMATKNNIPKESLDTHSKSDRIARLFGVTVRRVQQLTQEGIINTVDVKSGNGKTVKRYDTEETVQKYIKYLSDKANNRNQKSADLEDQKLEGEIRIKDARAQKLEMELQELRGEMHRSEDVEAVTNELVYSIRSMLLALPGRLAVDTCNAASPAEASDLIRQECYQILVELSDHQYDPDKYKAYVREREGWSTDLLPQGDETDDADE